MHTTTVGHRTLTFCHRSARRHAGESPCRRGPAVRITPPSSSRVWPILALANRPQIWFWLAAVCFVVSTSMFWHRSLSVDGPAQTAGRARRDLLPILDEQQVVAPPQMYPRSYGQRPRPIRTAVQPVSGEQTHGDDSPVVHAAWQTDDPSRERRVERVSVKSIEVDRPSPVWLTGSIEVSQPPSRQSSTTALAPARAQVRQPAPHPMRLVEQASARVPESAQQRVTPAAVSPAASRTLPRSSNSARSVAYPIDNPTAVPVSDLPLIIPATPSRKN